MLAGISSPPPVPYGGDKGQEGPPGWAYEGVDDFRVCRAFQRTSSRKSLGPDGISPLVMFGANGGSRPSMDGPGHRWMAWPPPLK